MYTPLGLESLPVELLYELQLYALSHSFPYTSRRIHAVFHSSPSFFRAQYIIGRVKINSPEIYTKALRYPICTVEVFDAICRQLPYPSSGQICDLPKRLFRSLSPKVGILGWKEREEPLPFLRHLFRSSNIPPININSYEGYALTKAVHAKFVLLIQFLLDHGASPQSKNGLAVMVAIRQKDLSLVKLLIERVDPRKTSTKRRKLKDRMDASKDMLKAAVRCDARDIVEYLTLEKGCIPDMETLKMMVK
ncbi:hypothetical protein BDZ94DRAFT_1306101 [Collybia nuda]|uniref:Ankyrin repeat domain-containing protein n=1 Tax=Collybia nuda TaxID=64659 RepID=A0A9P6CNA9_9AGAR|nr:hypothetical protein BDZ94DRAFT_1306101 [Collybia nuda]